QWICATRDENGKCDGPAIKWYMDPDTEDLFLATNGPEEWQRMSIDDPDPEVRPVPQAQVTDLRVDTDRISFDVDQVGTPVLVKTSYFPNWKVDGASGPYRVTPNLMVVVPNSNHVHLHYGTTGVEDMAWLLTFIGIGWVIFIARRKPVPMPEPA